MNDVSFTKNISQYNFTLSSRKWVRVARISHGTHFKVLLSDSIMIIITVFFSSLLLIPIVIYSGNPFIRLLLNHSVSLINVFIFFFIHSSNQTRILFFIVFLQSQYATDGAAISKNDLREHFHQYGNEIPCQ